MVGGTLVIDLGAPGKGTTVRAEIPALARGKPRIPLKKVTVLLAEDHAIVRQGLRTLLEAERHCEIVGERRGRAKKR